MTYKYTLDKNDYLTHQLYRVSKNPASNKRRIRNWIICVLVFLLFAFFFYSSGQTFMMGYFLIAAIITAIFYPMYHKWRFKNHYSKHIAENYNEFFNENVYLILNEDSFTSKDRVTESKIAYTDINQINELKDHLLIEVRKGQMLIVLKQANNDFSNLLTRLDEISKTYDIKWIDDTTWQWK